MVGAAAALCAAIALTGSSFAQQADAPAIASVIHAGRLLADPATGRVLTEQSILIGADGRVLRIEAGYVTPQGARVIESAIL